MKSIINSRATFLGLALLCVVADASALALGRASAAVLVGQPLSLTVPVQLGADEDMAALCFEADVLYGDIRQERTRVVLTTSPAKQGQSAFVRIVSKSVVDEPVVTVELRAGCSFKTSRRYVLLADMASSADGQVVVAALSAPAQPLSLSPSMVLAAPGTAARVGKKSRVSGKENTGAIRASSTRTGSDGPEVIASGAAPSNAGYSRAASTKTLQKSRLKLTAIDLSVERDPVLRSTDLLLGLPLENLEMRAQAIANWRALNATPEEVLRQDARVSSVNADLKILKDVTTKNQQALVSLAGRLEVAQSQRFRNPLVYGLALGLLACLLALAYLILKLRRGDGGQSPWWRGDEGSKSGISQTGAFADSVQPRAPYTVPVANAPAEEPQYMLHDPASDTEAVDVDLGFTASQAAGLFPESEHGPKPYKVEPSKSMQVPPQPTATQRPVTPQGSAVALSSINTREVLDVRQQAEFFVTLGQHDDAVHMLEYSINNSAETNPLVYLDLLTVLHKLSRNDDFERYRRPFNTLFSARVPPYTDYAEKGKRLEAYPNVCEHIVGLWPSEAAQKFIEQCLLRSSGPLAQEFDLNAFEDLLTLYGVLRRLVNGSESGFVPFSTSKPLSEPEPYLAGGVAGAAHKALTVPLQTTPAPVGPVDLDLSDEPSLSLAPINREK